jgi:hypothetical protein
MSAQWVRSPRGPGGSDAYGAFARFLIPGAVGGRGGRGRGRRWAGSPRHGNGHARAVARCTDSRRGGHRWCRRARVMGGGGVQVGTPSWPDFRCCCWCGHSAGCHLDLRVCAPYRHRVVGCDGASAGRLEPVAALSAEPPRDCAPAALRCAFHGLSRSTCRAVQGVRHLDTSGSSGDVHRQRPERRRGLVYTDRPSASFADECARRLVGDWWMFASSTDSNGDPGSCYFGYRFAGGG